MWFFWLLIWYGVGFIFRFIRVIYLDMNGGSSTRRDLWVGSLWGFIEPFWFGKFFGTELYRSIKSGRFKEWLDEEI